jgi:hypothetical protein
VLEVPSADSTVLSDTILSDAHELNRTELSSETGEEVGLGAINVLVNPFPCHDS